MERRKLWTAILLLLASACAAGQRPGSEPEASAICPEYRELRCATARECSMDRARDCFVCACAAANAATWPNGALPSAVSPDRRTPQ